MIRHSTSKTLVEDETGSSYIYASMVDGKAFVETDVDLSPFAAQNYVTQLEDSGGNKAWGYNYTAGDGEDLGSELLTDFDDNVTTDNTTQTAITEITGADPPVYTPTAGADILDGIQLVTDSYSTDNATINGEDNFTCDDAGGSVIKDVGITAGVRYKIIADLDATVGNWRIVIVCSGANQVPIGYGDGDGTVYFTSNSDVTGSLRIQGADNGATITINALTIHSLGPASGRLIPSGITEVKAVATIDDDCDVDNTGNWTSNDSTLAHDTDWYEITYVANTQFTYRTDTFADGKIYKLSYQIKDGTASSIGSKCGIGSGFNNTTWVDDTDAVITSSGAWQTFTTYMTAESDTDTFSIRTVMVGAGNLEVKNILVEEVLPIGHGETVSLGAWTNETNSLLVDAGLDMSDSAAAISDGSMIPVANSDWTFGDGAGMQFDAGGNSEQQLLNSGFTGTFTDDIPEDWSIIGTQDAGSYLTGDAVNDRVKITSDGSQMGFQQSVSASQLYYYEIDVQAITSGGFNITDGQVQHESNVTSTGLINGFLTTHASATYLGLTRYSGATDIDFNFFKLWKVDESYVWWDGSQSASSNVTQSSVLTASQLFKTVFTLSEVSAGNVSLRLGTTVGTERSSADTYTEYLVANDVDFKFRAIASFIGKIANTGLSVKQVTGTSTNGIKIVNSRNGTTENWASEDGSFDANDITALSVYRKPSTSHGDGHKLRWENYIG